MKETVYDIGKKNVGEALLSDEIFGAKPNKALIYEVVKMQLASHREGTAATRNHKMVSGTTAKMYRQKGTGRARHGDERTNIFVGGGKAFGPHPRDYSYRLPKKARRAGLAAALALKKQEGNLLILKDFPVKTVKTKAALAALEKLGATNCLLVIDEANEKLEKSVRNLPGVKLIRWEGLNVVDILRHARTVIIESALAKVQEVLTV